jgi:16S rRNA processing protein RimM
VVIATLPGPRGNKGELKAESLSSRSERFAALHRVFAGDRELEVESTWWHGDALIFKFKGVDSISDAQELAGLDVEVPREERVPLDADEYFLSDLVGCEVLDQATGEPLGIVKGWQELPGQILLDVGSFEAPFRRELFPVIDLAARRLFATLPDGLRDLNRSA